MSRGLVIFLTAMLLALGIGFLFAFGQWAPRSAWTGLAPIVITIGVVALAVVLFVAVRTLRRTPAGGSYTEAVARLGLSYDAAGGQALLSHCSDLPGIPKAGKVRHVLTGALDGRALRAMQHTYMIYTGQAVIPVSHTIYETEAPSWPAMHVSRRGALGRLLFKLSGQRGLLLEDPRFNAAFKVRCDDEDFALTLLSPEMQAFMLEKPGAAWRIVPGRVSLVYGGAMRADRIARSLDRLGRFWALVPKELEAW